MRKPQSFIKYSENSPNPWAHGGSSTNQIKDWLDPNNSGVSTLDGIDAVTGVAPVANFTSSIQSLPIRRRQCRFYDLSSNNPTRLELEFWGTPSTSNTEKSDRYNIHFHRSYTVYLHQLIHSELILRQ